MSLFEGLLENFSLRRLPDLWPILAPSKPPVYMWKMVEPTASSEGMPQLDAGYDDCH